MTATSLYPRVPLLTIASLALRPEVPLSVLARHVRGAVGDRQLGCSWRFLVFGVVRTSCAAMRATSQEVIRRLARQEAFYQARVRGLRLMLDSEGIKWRGTCPICSVDSFIVSPHGCNWACLRGFGGCGQDGTPTELADKLGASYDECRALELRLGLPNPRFNRRESIEGAYV